MKGYRYHPITKEYLGPVKLEKDPEGDGYILPGDATFVKPPSTRYFWDGEAWVKEL